MARKSSNLWVLIAIPVLIVGDCVQLVDRMLGTDEESVKAARIAALGPVPNLVGKTLVEAENEVEARDLDLSANGIGGSSSYCGTKTMRVVYRMSPKAGTTVQPEGEVAVSFMTAIERTFYRDHRKMPKVIGWSEAKADRFFDPISDVVDTTSKESKQVPPGADRVIAQSPKAG
jgi:hypothetical protein